MATIFQLANDGANHRLDPTFIYIGDGRARVGQPGSPPERITLANDAPVMAFRTPLWPNTNVVAADVGPLYIPANVDAIVGEGYAVTGPRALNNCNPRLGGNHRHLHGPSGFTGYLERADRIDVGASSIVQCFVCVSGRDARGEPVRVASMPGFGPRGPWDGADSGTPAGWVPPEHWELRRWRPASQWMLATRVE